MWQRPCQESSNIKVSSEKVSKKIHSSTHSLEKRNQQKGNLGDEVVTISGEDQRFHISDGHVRSHVKTIFLAVAVQEKTHEVLGYA